MINDMPLPQISERRPVKKKVTKSPKAIKVMNSSGNTEELEVNYHSAQVAKRQDPAAV